MECKSLYQQGYSQCHLRINRYIMECKLNFSNFKFSHYLGINRYIMECKYSTAGDFSRTFFGINRYIMECKFKCSEMGRRFYKELIDTLWNVNMLLQPRTMLAGRINRYIMECKFLYVTIYSIGT